jgi:hypothetical protein
MVISKASGRLLLGGPEPENTMFRPEHLEIPFFGVFSSVFQNY